MEIIKYLEDSKVVVKKDNGTYAVGSFFNGKFYEDQVYNSLEEIINIK